MFCQSFTLVIDDWESNEHSSGNLVHFGAFSLHLAVAEPVNKRDARKTLE
jgi:hypothetical protein